ncbi:hypothetical protein O181_074203 [Austropuccinia psidii MF-1]|uniref:Uncharacterized protein n=1 Tax=Austropuccinia psidii MF-1 TaxID=1389203 RepID=A0A9Q3IAR9_9BASI|nr:hypothetical protein [Austropuccinia psidii MF-1]
MPVQHLAPARQTRSQAGAQAVLTPTPRVPLDGTPAVPQLRTPFGRSSTIQEGRKRARKIGFLFRSSWCFLGLSRTNLKGPGEDGEEEEENSVDEEESECIEGVPAPVGASHGTG